MTFRESRRAGFTLVEVLIAAALLAVVTLASARFWLSAQGLQHTAGVIQDSETRIRRALNQVSVHLSTSGTSTLTPALVDPTDWTSELTFRKALGATEGGTAFGALHRIAFEYEDGEVDDGIDNNGNGLVDEGVIVYTRDLGEAEEARVTLVHGVAEFYAGETDAIGDENGNGLEDECGFHFQVEGSLITFRLTLSEVVDSELTITRSLETGVRLLN